ncbi:MAG: bifunctional (p)ppGpp synthetase/guanosine-3',5'-bis(diphosphate) 3'-pyrophosphohydrolase, partial [Mycoplasmataceae bacterium]|nr:bifunctional (p)ppGpp synthetase/guanosine-3',5'-bis(diphosphate) 3'-pyrophosphohydrolase [Mycoplasmataceae bacterium]
EKTPIEVQIMTSEMEIKTKIGLSSHVSYKEKHTKMLKSNNFLDYIMEYTNTLGAKKIAEDFIGDIKSDYLSSLITVLTPSGEKVNIKKGSTALDFAFKIHTELGLHSSYAKIDGVWAPLSRVLSGGDIVEIIKDDHKIVPLKSLEWVKTKKAADLIREAYINNHNISSNLEITYGRQIFEDYLNNNQEYREIINERYITKSLKLLKYNTIDDFYIALARKEVKLNDVLNIFRKNDRTFKKLEKNYRRDLSLTKVFEVDKQMNLNLNIDRLSYKIHDCNPIYGENIVGELIPTLIKKERKILVHRSNCYKVITGKEQKPASFIKIDWSNQRGIYTSILTLEIVAIDRKELVKDVIGIAYSSGSTIQYIESKFIDDDEKVKITLKLKVRDAKHFKKVLYLFNKLVGLDKIRRI